jgi:perosamine synthetase
MSAPDIDESDVREVVDVLRTGRLGLGPRAEEFERLMADYVGARHGIAVSSGTAGLHLIVRSLGLGPGDEVLVPSFTFVASVNAILYERATPVFVDVEPESFTLSIEDAKEKIGPRTRAVMVVDTFGHPADWESLETLGRRHDLKLIDDSCEALGAEYRGARLGALGDAAVFAFYPNKQMTTGEGGMVVTDDDRLAAQVRSLRNHGRGEMGAWLQHEQLGFNYRMDELSAALGLSQLRRLDSFLQRRQYVAERYLERLKGVAGIRRPVVKPDVKMSWFVFVITLDEGMERDAIMEQMQSRGVPVRGYFAPIHQQPYVREQHLGEVRLPVTESVARRTIALPFHNHLSEDQIDRVVDTLGEAIATVYAA